MKNKRIRRGIALIVSVLVGLQLFPMSALAAMMVTEEIAKNVSVSGNNAVPDIVAEVVEEREEFSKVYLLEDGSYYQITTCSPIHEVVNGEWENISNDLNEVLPPNTKEAETLLQQAVLSHTVSITRDIANATTYAIKAAEEPITEEFYNCDEIMGGSHNFTEDSRILIKPNEVGNFLAENKTILEANIVIDCSIEPENSRIYVKQIDQPWENINNYNDISTYTGETVDCISVSNDGTHKIDVTELFSRWENATAENNGVVLYAEEECDFTIDIVSISVRFDEIDMDDVDYTYHTIKMGQAGTLYVNDFTNTIRLEQEIIGTKGSILPIFIKRFYSSVNTTEKKPAGIGFTWNYCSKISFGENVVTWTLLDGSVRHFKSPSATDLITNGEYKKWIESGTYVGDASLWLKTEEDYSTMYIELDGATYRFNSSGNLTNIEFSNREIIISYDSSDRITSVSEDDAVLNFTYNSKNNATGYKHIEKITFNDSSAENAEVDRVDFSTTFSSGKAVHTTNYSDGTSVVYEYDIYANLLAVILNNSTRWELSYTESRSDVAKNCRRFKSCKKYQLVNGAKDENDEGETVLTIDSNKTYQREFVSGNNDKETLYFDKDINLISHEMSDGRRLFASYDDEGYLNSYVISSLEGTNNFLSDPGFEFGLDANSAWNVGEVGNIITVDTTSGEESEQDFGNNLLKINSGDYITDKRLGQACDGPFKVDQTYVFGASVKLNSDTISNDRNGFKISIYKADSAGNCDIENGLITSIGFDTCSKNEWHYKLAAFKLEEAQSCLYFVIEYDGPGATIKVDNATLYEAEPSKADIPGVAVSTAGTIIRNEDGSISSEILTDNIVSMITSYEYDENNANKLTSITDYNGITTYYTYNDKNELVEIENKKTNGDVVKKTMFSYQNSIKTVYQTVTDVSTGNVVNMSSEYVYDNNQIESVTHNGVSYNFKYDGGNLDYVYTLTQEESGTGIQNRIIDYSYQGSDIGEIRYINGLTVKYEYNSDGMIARVEYDLDGVGDSANSSTIKILNYTYDNEGFLNVTDSQTGFRIVYTDTGYKLYKSESGAEKLLYVLENNADGSTTETYGPEINGELLSSVTTTKTNKDYNPITKSTTHSSSVSLEKITEWINENDYESWSYNYDRQSVTDYFGRVLQKSLEMQILNSNEKKSKITETFSYKELEEGVTSALISSHSTTITEEDNPIPMYSDNQFYEYDCSGNITLVYTFENEVKKPLVYYAYDEAGQLKGEVNYESGVSATYTYDKGGNLTSKQTHLISEAIVNGETNEIISYGSMTNCNSFVFDSNRLIKYNNQNISYDAFGNPLNYFGTTFNVSSIGTNPAHFNNTIEGDLEWHGDKLSAFETEDYRYEYSYDENGYRIKTIRYKKTATENNGYEYALEQEKIYIWNDGVLKSIVIDDENEPMRSDIVYDQEGNMTGFISHIGIPVYFVKDLNGSVRRLVTFGGDTIALITYDAWGVPSITINAEYLSLAYITYGTITLLNPSAYNGYFFDYETGLYFCKERVYSPAWCRFLNMNEVSSLLEPENSATSANLYSFCNNNPVNVMEPYGAWAKNQLDFEWNVNGFEINMCEAFLSRPFCMIFANQFVKKNGSWNYSQGYNYRGMDALEIAATLFAKCVGKNAMFAVNSVNACWGDGWLFSNKKADTIVVKVEDDNYWKYEKIWYAASDIKMYAWSQGIYITI